MSTNMTSEEVKQANKEAFKEWLDDKVLTFGWWSIKTIGAAVLGGILLFLANHGLIGH